MRSLPLVIAVLLAIPYASATYITINSQLPEVYTNENFAQAKLTVSNTGDEAAFSVQSYFKLTDALEAPMVFIGKLDPEKQVDTSFNFNITKNILPGRYPVIILTEYADANNYIFSAVSSSFLAYKERTSSEINGFLEDVQIPKGGSTKARLKIVSTDSEDRNLTVGLFLPKELSYGKYDKNTLIKAGERKSVEVEISSLAALQGSTYTVFAVVEYENGGKHYSSFSRGSVLITKNEGLFSTTLLGGAILILAAAFFAYNMGRRKR
ncbi:MAG: hypothetical protein HY515_03190 [Candidatus Aenigmarchaeota archaeon]|nr:hypothetical protein [Candidatus Aenigmarchaeota archaeon]